MEIVRFASLLLLLGFSSQLYGQIDKDTLKLSIGNKEFFDTKSVILSIK